MKNRLGNQLGLVYTAQFITELSNLIGVAICKHQSDCLIQY